MRTDDTLQSLPLAVIKDKPLVGGMAILRLMFPTPGVAGDVEWYEAIDAVIDTGFSGGASLPFGSALSFGLRKAGEMEIYLAGLAGKQTVPRYSGEFRIDCPATGGCWHVASELIRVRERGHVYPLGNDGKDYAVIGMDALLRARALRIDLDSFASRYSLTIDPGACRIDLDLYENL